MSMEDIEHRRARDYNLQIGERIVNILDFARPSLVLVHLVEIERFAAVLTKLVGKFEYRMRREIEIVQRSIKHFRGIDVVILLYMLKQHRGLTHAAGADDSDQAVVPVYMPVQIPRKARFGSTGKNMKNASE